MLTLMATVPGTDDPLLAESWAAEIRVNMLRAVAISVLYGWHLLRYQFGSEPGFTPRYHAAVTAIAIFGLVLVGIWHAILVARIRPRWLPAVTTIGDLVVVTALYGIGVSTAGSQSLVLFFLVVGSTAFRCSLATVWVAAIGSVAGYLAIQIKLYADAVIVRKESGTPFWWSLFLPAILVAGLMAGQAVRQSRRLARGRR